MVDTVQTAIFRLGLDNQQYVQAAERTTQANQKLVSSTEQLVVAEEKVSVKAHTTADAFAKLEARYEPLIRNEQRRQAAIAQATRYLDEGTVAEARYAEQIARVNAFYDQQATAIARANSSQQAFNLVNGASHGIFNRSRIVVQQAGYAVAGFAADLTSGVSVLRTFTSQGGAMLSMFGPWGAVIGAAVSAVGALAIGLGAFGDEAEAAEGQQEKLNDQLERASELMDEINGKAQRTIASLFAERQNIIEVARLAVTNAEIRLESLRGESGMGPLAPRERQELRLAEEDVARLKKQLTLLRAELGEFDDGFIHLGETASEALAKIEADAKKAAQEAERAREEAVRESERKILEVRKFHAEQAARQDQDWFDARKRGHQMVLRMIEDEKRAEEKAADERAREAEKRAKELEREAERQADLMLEPFRNAARGIQDAFADAFSAIFKGNIDGFKDLAARITDIMAELSAQVAAMLVFQPILGSVVGSFGPAGLSGSSSPSGFNLSSMFNSGGGGFNLESLFSFGGGGITSPAGTARGGQGVPGGLSGSSFSWGGAGITAALNLLPLAFTALSGGKLTGSSIGSAIGGTIGGIGGSFLGPVGSFIGSALGNLLGGLIGGLFGGKPARPTAFARFGASGGQLNFNELATGHGGDDFSGDVTSLADTAVAAVNAALKDLGGTLTGFDTAADQIGIRGRTPNIAVYVNGVKRGFETDQAGAQAAISDFTFRSLQHALQQGNLTGLTSTGETILRNSSSETFAADLAFGKLYDQLIGIAPITTQYADAVKALNEQFDEAARKAKELGLAIQPLETARTDAILKLTTDFNKGIADSILSITDPLQLALNNLAKAQEDRLKEAMAAGADLVAVERLSQLERQRVIEGFTAAQTQDLMRFYESLRFGALSGASPADSLSGSRASFVAAAAQAQAGDINARGRLTELGTQFLGYSRAFNASGVGYQQDVALATSLVGPLIGGGSGTLQQTLTDVGSALARLQVAGNQTDAEIRDEVVGLREDFSRLSAQLSRLLAALPIAA